MTCLPLITLVRTLRHYRLSLLGIGTLTLVACGESAPQTIATAPPVADVLYTYPYAGQQQVPTFTQVSLKLSSPMTSLPEWQLRDESTGEPVDGALVLDQDDPTLLFFTPDRELPGGHTFSFSIDDISTSDGLTHKDMRVTFTTVADQASPRSATLELSRLSPEPPLPFMDFSPVLLDFSQDLDPHSLTWGDTIGLYDEQGHLVDSELLVKGHRVTIDPAADLNPDQVYRLELGHGVRALSGSSLNPLRISLTPVDSGSHATSRLALRAPDSARSPLSDSPMNTANMASPLIGDNNASSIRGLLEAELADIRRFPDITPFVVRKGTVLSGSALDVVLGGQVPAQLNCGGISLTLLSDAVGYIVANPYASSRSARKNLRMSLDLALATEDPTVNAMISQTVLHNEVVGTFMIEDGRMQIDALGGLRGELMRLTRVDASMALHFESLASTEPDPVHIAAAEPFGLKSSFPENGTNHFHPDEHLSLFFSKALDSGSAQDLVSLEKLDGDSHVQWPVQVVMDGSKLSIQPSSPLAFGQNWRLNVAPGLKAVDGSILAEAVSIDFSTPVLSTEKPRAVMVKTAYPGVPYALTGMDLGNNIAGRALGGLADDDIWPVFTLPANHEINLYFTQPLDTSTVIPGTGCDTGTLRVERIDNTGQCLESVAGHWQINQQRLRFTPDTPWAEGTLYRYVLMSGDDNLVCDDGEICSATTPALPLNTDPLTANPGIGKNKRGFHSDIGGPPLVMPFRGVAASPSVFNPLLSAPFSDINGNGELDAGEVKRPENSQSFIPTATAGIVSGVRIGCDFNKTCADDAAVSYLNNTMIVEVGDYEEERGGIAVPVYPMVFFANSVTMYAKALGGLLKMEIPTGTQIIRTRHANGQPLDGSILPTPDNEAGEPQPATFDVTAEVYLDTPYLQIMEGLVASNLHSLPFTLHLRGPITFLPDGRMQLHLSNINEIKLNVEMQILSEADLATLLGIDSAWGDFIDQLLDKILGGDHTAGTIEFTIPAGQVFIHLTGEPPQ